ncbi:unnamed protein product [Orchesella dallaii]|uniref:Uncharacterized protein n=1 Tax=Orchesella dallaii TaxID=48710 RepID=A0ABP1PHZ5_9HEXA
MISKLTEDVIKIQIWLAYKLRTIPFYWDDSKQKFVLDKNPSMQWQFKVCSNTLLVFYLAALLHFTMSIISGNETLSFLLLNTVSASAHLSGLIMVCGNQKSSYEFCRLFSCIKTFGVREFLTWKPLLPSRTIKNPSDAMLTIIICILIGVVAPVFLLITFLLPCHQVSSTLIKTLVGPSTCHDRRYQLLSYIIELGLFVPPSLVISFQDILFMDALRTINRYVSALM